MITAETVSSPSGVVDLRRDVHALVRYIQQRGLTLTKRENCIPKTDARRLAKLLSWEGEAREVEESGGGVWSGTVLDLARRLGLVSYDTKGVLMGYSSREPCFPYNDVRVDGEAFETWLQRSPLEKERALLNRMVEDDPSEFFYSATLLPTPPFDTWASATGPASRMDLPVIRRGLLEFLAALEPGVWHEFRPLVDRLQQRLPHLVLDPATRGPDGDSIRKLRDWEWESRRGKGKKPVPKPDVVLEDLYTNFRETPRGRYQGTPVPRDFHRVEGRYLEFFLREIPYLMGFVDLAFRAAEDPVGLEVEPHYDRLRAIRLTPRLRQVVQGDPEMDRVRVTVLPTFEVLVEAPSHPEVLLEALAPYTSRVQEGGPVHRLRLERARVVEASATRPEAVTDLLEGLAGSPLPGNVASDLSAWMGRADRVVVYEGFGLLELPDAGVLDGIRGSVAEECPGGFALIRQPEAAFRTLEEGGHVPMRVVHRADRFASGPGRLAAPPAPKPSPQPVRLTSEDLVGFRASRKGVLETLHEALRDRTAVCLLAEGRLILSAEDLPLLRQALADLGPRFAVTLEGPHAG